MLAERMPTGHLLACVDCLADLMGDQLVTDNTATWAREGRVAARFASAVGAEFVWMQDRPDLGLEMPDASHRYYEITEVLEPNRRRNDEYKEDRLLSQSGENSVRTIQPDSAATSRVALRDGSNKKAEKAATYGDGDVGLVVYLNTDLMAFDDCIAELEAGLHDDTAAAGCSFRDVWVLWSDRLYLVWENGQAVTLSPMLRV